MTTTEAYRYAQDHPEAAQKAQEQVQAMLRRSATDYDFRQKLLSDPRAAFGEFTGNEVPDTFNVAFIENKADATIVLPDYSDPDAELSEEDLEAVSGGDISLGAAALIIGTCMLIGAIAGEIENHIKD